jgi:cytochrome c biogenesis factor
MDNNQLGSLVVGLGVVLGLIGTVYSMIYKPIHSVSLELVRLNTNLENLRLNDDKQNKTLDIHGIKLADHDKDITRLNMEVRYIKDRA